MIFVAGHNGLVGSSILNILKKKRKKIITVSKKKLNLENFNKVNNFFKKNRITEVYLCAAKVGGIYANNTYPYNFINSNILIQNNVINCCLKYKIKKLMILGSSCIYPRNCPQPIKEKYLLSGNLESTNRPYAIAKISGIEQIWACNRQFHTNYFALMPTNLYGPNDNYDQYNSHVIPGMIRKVANAKINKEKKVIFWGTGKPKREFMYSDDLANIAVKLMNSIKINKNIFNNLEPPLLNVGSGQEISIKKLAQLICQLMKYEGEIVFNKSFPDGTPRKILNSNKLNKLIKINKFTKLRDGLILTIRKFIKDQI